MRRAWFEQVVLHAPFDSVPTFVDRFDGHWQDGSGGRWRVGYSPPCLTLDEARAWCDAQAVTVAEVDVIADTPGEDFHTDRYAFFGTGSDLAALDEPALHDRSVPYNSLPSREWVVSVTVSLGFDDYVDACKNTAAARGQLGLREVTCDDIGGRIELLFATSAPTEEMATGFATQAMQHALTHTRDGLGDALNNGFSSTVQVLSPRLKRRF